MNQPIVSRRRPNRNRLLLITDAVIASTQIRCLSPFDRLRQAGALEWRLARLAEFSTGDVGWPDAVVFSRVATPAAVALLDVFRRLGTPVVYDFDDDFLHVEDPGNPRLCAYYRRPEIRRAIKHMLSRTDRVVVSTEPLAELARRYNRRVTTIENCLDLTLLRGVEATATGQETVIGYAGTPHREGDFTWVTPALERLLASHAGQLKLHFMGFAPKALQGRPEVVCEPFEADYSRFIRRLAQTGWAVGLAPLEDHRSKLAKSDVKFLEYGACRIAGVYSDVLPYRSVEDGRAGLRAANRPDSWYRAICRLLSDPDLRRDIVSNAYARVREDREVAGAAEAWRGLLREMRPATGAARGAAGNVSPGGIRLRRALRRFEASRRRGVGARKRLKRWLRAASPGIYGLLKRLDRHLSRQRGGSRSLGDRHE